MTRHPPKRKNKSAIILGCGPSINLFKKEHLPWLDTLDKWSVNNFIIHDFIVPDFYNIEVKGWTIPFLQRMVQLRKIEYKNTTWMLHRSEMNRSFCIVPRIIDPNVFDNIYSYYPDFVTNVRKYTPKYGHVVAKRGCSMSILIDLSHVLQYEVIYFMGIDLYSSEYFWTDNPKYENLNIPNELTYNKPDLNKKTDPHTTTELFLKYMMDFIESKKTNMINLSPDSLLADIMVTENLEDLCKK